LRATGDHLRLGVYTDLELWQDGARPVGAESFLLYVLELRRSFAGLVVAARLAPGAPPPAARYVVPDDVEIAALPHYPSLSHPLGAARALGGSLRAFWRMLDDVDVVWLLGPHPLALAFALQALARRRGVVLGVRQDFPAYMRTRHPGSRAFRLVGDVLEGAWRALGRVAPVVAVGPELARNYRRARGVLPAAISLVRAGDLPAAPPARERGADAPFHVLSVGRLDPEKNPVLMADVLADLVARGVDARLTVCGSGSLEDALAARLRELGVDDRAQLRGYVALDGSLQALYAQADALLHVSWTEGMPQVLLEAFGAGLPVVATEVGGVPDVAGDAALLVAPGDAPAAGAALARLAAEPGLRAQLAAAGLERVRERTLEAETARVAAFIASAARPWPFP
jgi:glycosyltransferase involved in cell wall biosynthesis